MPLHWIAQNCHLARVYADIADGWGDSVKPILHFWADNPQLASFRNPLLKEKGSVYYNDPDQLMIGNPGLSVSEWEAQMGMWVMFAAPLILSTEIRRGALSAEAKRVLLNKEVLALADDPLGLQVQLFQAFQNGCLV